MNAIIYVRQTEKISLYEQFNKCADYCKKRSYSIGGKVLDFDGKHFHEAVNKVIADDNITMLIIYSSDDVFADYEEKLFYRIYFDKLNKMLISCT